MTDAKLLPVRCAGLGIRVLTLSLLALPLTAGWREMAANGAEHSETTDFLTDIQWAKLEKTVDRGLEFLATQQNDDGSFKTLPVGKPGITSLCVLAFLSRGHLPNQGPYGDRIDRAVQYVVSTQRGDGLFTSLPTRRPLTTHGPSHAAMYNHGFAGWMLGEVYGISGAEQEDRIRGAIKKAVRFSRAKQLKDNQWYKGGFDYLVANGGTPEGDLPITALQLMLFRSAKNAGFDVPVENIDAAMHYVRRRFDRDYHVFFYRSERTISRGCTATGILALSLGGEHETDMARLAGNWLLRQPIAPFNTARDPGHDRYFYSVFYCSQAMFQLGGRYWKRFYPSLLNTLSANQRHDGSWERERTGGTARFGNAYSSALAILSLTPPYMMLPLFQR